MREYPDGGPAVFSGLRRPVECDIHAVARTVGIHRFGRADSDQKRTDRLALPP